ncbi:hypothetical protein XVE_1189 [Xanthomonas vesicatoria ATCC 35937]|uniref:Uncharacterized protein n=1 Tax=Xanthomonas vesicatoria ATCC 35937 TaxID=925775 RepID=F0BAS2_9XANT|nr:hypothetical protein XVE_1189 [Xanthomonas vesicatoria ATCC 35937]
MSVDTSMTQPERAWARYAPKHDQAMRGATGRACHVAHVQQ